MISFDLRCGGAHIFEIWFRSSVDYDTQLARGLIACPLCGSSTVEKAAMAPNIGGKANRAMQAVAVRAEPVPSTERAPVMSVLPDGVPPSMQAVIAMVAAAQAEALPKSRWVGKAFAAEARAIHAADEDVKPMIHGEATLDEAQALADDGIAVLPLLVPFVAPESRN